MEIGISDLVIALRAHKNCSLEEARSAVFGLYEKLVGKNKNSEVDAIALVLLPSMLSHHNAAAVAYEYAEAFIAERERRAKLASTM